MDQLQKRRDLQTHLEALLGSKHVYFQPPPSVKMQYPAIVYELADVDKRFADNQVYISGRFYQITIIDPDPESSIAEMFEIMPRCKFDRYFATDELNHTLYTLYY